MNAKEKAAVKELGMMLETVLRMGVRLMETPEARVAGRHLKKHLRKAEYGGRDKKK